MKKTVSLILILISLFTYVYAEFKNPSIVDDAGYLMQYELEEVSAKLDRIRNKYNFDVVIYTESEMSGFSAQESADDIYDYKGYGAGDGDDGIMLYICADTREYHFTTHGKGIEYFSENGLAFLESRILPYLENNDYYNAFEEYTETAEELLEMAMRGQPYNKRHYSTGYIAGVVAVCISAPLLIAFLMTRKKLKKMKTATENNYAENYMKQGSLKIDISRDLFLYSRISKTEKVKQSSGTHTSSSGRVHGGRGGSF